MPSPKHKRVNDAPEILFEDDDRIDWERRQRHKVDLVPDETVHDVDDDPDLLTDDDSSHRGKKDHRKKRRHYVMDEARGQVVVQRRRKRQRHARNLDDALLDDGYE